MNLIIGFLGGGLVALFLAAAVHHEFAMEGFWLTATIFFGAAVFIWWLRGLWDFVTDLRLGRLRREDQLDKGPPTESGSGSTNLE